MVSAERIRALRARLGWSQAQLARAAGVGSGAGAIETVRRWERLGAGDRLYAAILARIEVSDHPAEVLAAARDDDPLAGLTVLLAPSAAPVLGVAQRVSDDAITAALRDAQGVVRAAARALGVTAAAVRERLRTDPALWPAGVDRRRRRVQVPDGDLVAALRASGGGIAAAARALGVTSVAVYARLKKCPALWPSDLPPRARRSRRAKRRTKKPATPPSGGPPRGRFPPETWDGRRVGILTLRGLVRRPDGSVWARAVCDCGRETFVRSGQVAPGARVPTRSCGCRRGGGPRRSYEGTSVGSGGRVIHDDGAAAVIAACPDGHAWTIDRTAVLGAAPTSERSSLKCPQCRVSRTRDLRGDVFGLLTVLRRAGTDAPADGRYRSQATWWCRCECGTEKAIRGAHLRSGATRSCGAPECKAHLRDVGA